MSAAASVGEVTLTQLLERTQALLAFPRLDDGTVDVVFDRTPSLSAGAGRAVEIDYRHNSSVFSFHTTVSAIVDPCRWRLSLPNAISVEKMRGAVRVPNPSRVTLRLEPTPGAPMQVRLHDLSATGVAFAYPSDALELTVEQRLIGTMTLRGLPAPMLLEVRHTRAIDAHERLAGCHIEGMSPVGHERLWNVLSRHGVTR